MTAYTDPTRKRKSDPGHPETCNIFHLHEAFEPAKAKGIPEECRAAKIGCVDCKKLLAQEVNAALAPLRERRSELANKPDYVNDVLSDGARRAQAIARETIREVKGRMNLLRRET